MASLQTYDFTSLVRNTVAAIQAGSSKLINLSVGSVLRALVEAVSGVILWLQGLVTYVLTLTRFATSSGSDADSWGADFGYVRLLSAFASGQVTFYRFTATAQAVVPFGSVVQTADGTQSFTVETDPTNPAYSESLGGYVLPINTSSVTVTVVAVNAGTQGNVAGGTITSMGQGIPGIDTVTNASAFINGIDVEADPSYKTRFPLWLQALSKATKLAIASAILSVEANLRYTITENYDYNNTYDPGFFYLVIDDGSGDPSSDLLNSVGSAVEAVRGLGIRYAVFGPNVVTANVNMTLTTASGYDHPTVVGQVGTALQNFINGLTIGTTLPYSQLAAVAYSIPGVTNATSITLNSGTSDLTATNQQTIRAGTITVA